MIVFQRVEKKNIALHIRLFFFFFFFLFFLPQWSRSRPMFGGKEILQRKTWPLLSFISPFSFPLFERPGPSNTIGFQSGEPPWFVSESFFFFFSSPFFFFFPQALLRTYLHSKKNNQAFSKHFFFFSLPPPPPLPMEVPRFPFGQSWNRNPFFFSFFSPFPWPPCKLLTVAIEALGVH